MSKPIFFMMCGLQGSGKSTQAQRLAKEYDASVFSSDALRIEMFNDVNEQSRNVELFKELHKRIKKCLKSGKSAVMDCTNINSKRRRSFLQELNKINCERRCVVMATPYEQCVKNNATRDRNVPKKAITKAYRHWNTPAMFEGWDSIEAVYWEGSENSRDIRTWLDEHMNYSQNTPYHKRSLGEHCLRVGSQFEEGTLLNYAGYLHDVGKPATRSFINSKGETTEIAHYYCHENAGAYDSLFFDYNGKASPLEVSLIINLHMKPYHCEKSDKIENLHNKYRKLWGKQLYNKVNKLHEADRMAH